MVQKYVIMRFFNSWTHPWTMTSLLNHHFTSFLNLLRLLFLLEGFFQKIKVWNPLYVCIYMSAGRHRWTGVFFLRQRPKTKFGPILAKIQQKNILYEVYHVNQRPYYWGFRWVSLFYEYLCGYSCQNWCGIIFQPTVTFFEK